MGISLSFATALLGALTAKGASTFANRINPCYLGLSTTIPNSDGSNFTEPSADDDYERTLIASFVNVSNYYTIFGNMSVTDNAVSVTNVKQATIVPPSSSWGTIVAIGFFNSLNATTPSAFATLDTSVTLETDVLPLIRVGDLTFTLSTTTGTLSDTALQELLPYFIGGNAIPPLSSVCYMGLSTTTPSSDGSNFTEPSGSDGYSRIDVAQKMASAVAYGDGSYYTYNSNTITFPTALDEWGTLTHFGLFDSATSETPVLWGELVTEVEIEKNFIPIFKIGAFKITI